MVLPDKSFPAVTKMSAYLERGAGKRKKKKREGRKCRLVDRSLGFTVSAPFV